MIIMLSSPPRQAKDSHEMGVQMSTGESGQTYYLINGVPWDGSSMQRIVPRGGESLVAEELYTHHKSVYLPRNLCLNLENLMFI